jgi:hypothetical protein
LLTSKSEKRREIESGEEVNFFDKYSFFGDEFLKYKGNFKKIDGLNLGIWSFC